MMSKVFNRDFLLLFLCQGLFLTNNVTFVAINGLVGLQLAPLGWMATIPIAAFVAGGALASPLVAKHQRLWGRRKTFLLGLATAFVSCGLCAVATQIESFWLLCSATLLAGYFNANASLYRFAATELVTPSLKEKAISWLLAGGLMGAVIGPNLASATKDIMAPPFTGAYIALMLVALLAFLAMSQIQFPPINTTQHSLSQGRPLKEIMKQPGFIIACTACALSYGIMNLLMAATPIAMAQCQHPFSAAVWVLEWHVVGMYAPSFFTGDLIKRFGALSIMVMGLLLNFACVAVALSGIDLHHFLIALFLLGVGWNFLYIGGTTLATENYRPEEKTSAQSAVDFTVYATMTLTAFGSGALVTTGGWTAMNLGSLFPLILMGLALIWLKIRQNANPRQVA